MSNSAASTADSDTNTHAKDPRSLASNGCFVAILGGVVAAEKKYTQQNLETDSRQQTADSRQQTADNRQQTAQQTADSRQPEDGLWPS